MSSDEALTRGGYTYRVTCRAMPNQVEGVRTADGRPFYFRARHGQWRLHLGPVGARGDWEDFDDYSDVIASGVDPRAGVWDVETVLDLLDRHRLQRCVATMTATGDVGVGGLHRCLRQDRLRHCRCVDRYLFRCLQHCPLPGGLP